MRVKPARRAPNYWLFQIMFDEFPVLWETSVRKHVAAQHYPSDWTNVEPNTKRFQQLKRGDRVIAAFRRHRFAGYGELKSDFYHGGPSLRIQHEPNGELQFGERFDCDWCIIPLDREPPFIECYKLKTAGFHIDLERGRAVRQIDKATFEAIKERLDLAGAQPAIGLWLVKAREVLKDGSAGWHWRNYFDGSESGLSWGGRDRIRSSASMKFLREEVREGDLIVAYQADDRSHGPSIFGFTRFASRGMQDPPGSGKYNLFDIPSTTEAYVIEPPLRRDDLYATGCRPHCFTRGSQGTIFRLAHSEFNGIIAAARGHSPIQFDDLLAWLRAASFPELVSLRDSYVGPDDDDEDVDRECGVADVDKRLDKLERKLANRSPVYVANKVRQWIRNDRPFIRALKAKYNFQCQFPGCHVVIRMRNGECYSEVAHVQPVATGGRSVRLNLLVLCPNHHKMWDYGDVQIDVNTRSIISGKLNGSRFRIVR